MGSCSSTCPAFEVILHNTSRATPWVFALFLLATSCAGGSRGCGSFTPLPADPAPYGVPANQLIAGGMQLRVTAAGVPKLTTALDAAIPPTICIPPTTLLDQGIGPLHQVVSVCDKSDCLGSPGCPLYLYKNAAERPASVTTTPPDVPTSGGDDDGKDHASFTVQSSTTSPSITYDRAFDAWVPLHAVATGVVGADCYLDAYDTHVTDDTANPPEVVVPLNLSIGTDGILAIAMGALTVNNLQIGTAGCSELGSLVGSFASALTTTLQNQIQLLLQPQLNAIVQGLIPNPAGVAGVIDFADALAPYAPPANLDLEVLSIAGGYVETANNGVNIGVIAGMNSDRDTTTRADASASEPALCVGDAAVPDLSAAPWSLPFDPAHGTFSLDPAQPFDGTADPMAGSAPADVVLGVSGPFLGLAVAHAVNSGALCLSVTDTNLPALTTGALSVLVDSTGSIYGDRRASLVATVHPAGAPSVTLGTGAPDDPRVVVGFQRLAIDVAAGSPPAKAFTVTLDMQASFDIGVSQVGDGRPGLELLLLGTQVANAAISTAGAAAGALVADPARLAGVAGSLADVVARRLAGQFSGPAALPSYLGYALDNLTLGRAQSTQCDFISIAATLVAASTGATLDTTALLASETVPDEAHLRALYNPVPPVNAPVPQVKLNLGPAGAEYSVRVDGSAWRAWSTDANPTITDDALLLQGHHIVDARARNPGDWRSEDPTPAHLEFIVDSVPPELHPSVDAAHTAVSFNGYDLVTLDAALVYAWNDVAGAPTAFASASTMTMTEALAVTKNATVPLVILAKDESGNVGTVQFDLRAALAGDAGVDAGLADASRDGGGADAAQKDAAHASTDAAATGAAEGGAADNSGESSGCGCRIGGAPQPSALAALAWLLGLIGIGERARRRKRVRRGREGRR